jgi:hypothetical protein
MPGVERSRHKENGGADHHPAITHVYAVPFASRHCARSAAPVQHGSSRSADRTPTMPLRAAPRSRSATARSVTLDAAAMVVSDGLNPSSTTALMQRLMQRQIWASYIQKKSKKISGQLRLRKSAEARLCVKEAISESPTWEGHLDLHRDGYVRSFRSPKAALTALPPAS